MSRAFLKEEAFDDPVLIPPRAPLPAGMVNYVTPRGLNLLTTEMGELETDLIQTQSIKGNDSEKTRRLTVIRGRITDLRPRISGAMVVNPAKQPHTEVRFGATVTIQITTGNHAGEERMITIVGVDEADANEGRMAFVAPISRALIGRKAGETTILQTPHGEAVLEITRIDYRKS